MLYYIVVIKFERRKKLGAYFKGAKWRRGSPKGTVF